MLKSLSLLLVCYLVSPAFGQSASANNTKRNKETGFYGKRFVIQLGAGIHHNSLLKWTSDKERFFRNFPYYKEYRSQITSDQFNYSLYGNIGVVLKEQFSLSLDFNYYYGNIFLAGIGTKYHGNDSTDYYYFTSKYDVRAKYNTIRIMPRLEFATKGSNAPAGLVHILAIGAELSQLQSRNYRVISSLSSVSNPSAVQITDSYVGLSKKTVVNITAMYGLEYRLPISKSFAWNFGGYAHINFPALFPTYIDESDYNMDETEQERQLAKYRFQNLISFRTGLVIML